MFVINPIDRADNFPNMPGPGGFFCRDGSLAKAAPSAYILYHVALWDIEKESKVFQNAITPSDVSIRLPMSCAELAKLSKLDLAQKLKGPFLEAIKLSLASQHFLLHLPRQKLEKKKAQMAEFLQSQEFPPSSVSFLPLAGNEISNPVK